MKAYLLLLILLILTLLYYSICDSKYNYSTPYILNKKEFIKFINNDEDDFLKNLSLSDLYARNIDVFKNDNNPLEEYQQSIYKSIPDNISSIVIERLKILTIKVDKILYKSYPDIAKINWKIALFKNKNYEQGLPHTRKDIIFLPIEMFDCNYIKYYYNYKQILVTLIHEKIHVFQRKYPNHKYIIDYMNYYGYRKYMKYNEFRKLKPLVRSNPDLDDWIYKDDKNVYYSEYNDIKPKTITDVKSSSPSMGLAHLEHPYERMAYEISSSLVK